MSDGIVLTGTFAKATTTVDGGWNLTFAVNQSEVIALTQVSELRDLLLRIVVIPADLAPSEEDGDGQAS